MNRSGFTLSRIAATLFACLLLLPRLVAAAEPLLATDFDGDGLYDRVALSRRGSSTALEVWFSASNTTQSILTDAPVRRIIAADIDGDRRPELIAADSQRQIHVWTRKHKKLKPYRLPQAAPVILRHTGRHHVADSDVEPPDAVVSPEPPTFALLYSSPLQTAPPDECATLGLQPARPHCSVTAYDRFLPRPPPSSSLG